jgi:hypothetical protein
MVLTPGIELAKSLKAKESGKKNKNRERTTGSFMKTIDSLRVFKYPEPVWFFDSVF